MPFSHSTVRISSEYLITLDSEIKYYRPPRNRFTLVSSFFLLNRYLPIFGHVPFVLATMLKVDQATVSLSLRIQCHGRVFRRRCLCVLVLACFESERHMKNDSLSLSQICPKLTVYHEYFALVVELNVGCESSPPYPSSIFHFTSLHQCPTSPITIAHSRRASDDPHVCALR